MFQPKHGVCGIRQSRNSEHKQSLQIIPRWGHVLGARDHKVLGCLGMWSRELVVVYTVALRKNRSDALKVKFQAETPTDTFLKSLQDLGRSEMGRGSSALMR